jgi:acetoin utilization protein AcuB
MLVRDWMSKNVVTIQSNESLNSAVDIMTENQISMLPVMEYGKLVGIVTDRDIKRSSPSDVALLDIQHILYHMSKLDVGSIMTRYPITIPIYFTLEEAAEVLLQNNISGVPVLNDDGVVCGIITKNDVFRAIMSVSGVRGKGIMMGFLVDDRPGSVKEIIDVARKFGARISSILSSYEKAPQGYRRVYLRMFDIDRPSINDLRAEMKTKGKLLYFIDKLSEEREVAED